MKELAQRKNSLRLGSWDYSQAGYYFITICLKNRNAILGKINDRKMQLSSQGYIVRRCWKELIKHYKNCSLDAFIIMPDHVHGIIIIKDPKHYFSEAADTYEENQLPSERAIHESPPLSWKRRKMLISKIIGRFKMQSAKSINILRNSPGHPLWQRNYHDHIIRTEQALENIRLYIKANPARYKNENDKQKIV